MTTPAMQESLRRIPSMMPDGAAVELGTWLGASTRALVEGIEASERGIPLVCYDQWRATEPEVEKARVQGFCINVGDDLLPLARQNIQYPLIAVRGDIGKSRWCGAAIGCMIFDQAKRDPAWSHCLAEFGPHWMNGCVIALLDFSFWRRVAPDKRHDG